MFVASSRGRVFYFVGCNNWQSLSKANLRFFKSESEARVSGYSPSTARGCGVPVGMYQFEALATIPVSETNLMPGEICVVDRVVDGDTLKCEDGRDIRLLLIDAPEMGQGVFGDLAKTALEALAPIGSSLGLYHDVEHTDRYGRTLAHLETDGGSMVNEEMIRKGMAVVSVYPPNVALVERYRAAAADAQKAKIGLWALNGFECEPGAFRRGECR